jgi:hypothetical protein
VTPRHGRAVRLSGGEKRRWRGRRGVEHEVLVAGVDRHDRRVLAASGAEPASPLPTTKERQAQRAQRAVEKHTPLGRLGKAARALREKMAALRGAQS